MTISRTSPALRPYRPRAATMELIEHVQRITDRYERQGIRLTIRQVFYQLVAGNRVPNTERQYHDLSDKLTRARRAGLMPLDAYDDHGRIPYTPPVHTSAADAIRNAADRYAADLWRGYRRVEVWSEKDAARSVLQPVAAAYLCTYQSTRGFMSMSALAAAVRRNRRNTWTVLIATDHDPSGLKIADRLAADLDAFTGGRARVERLALTREQIDRFNPPPQPAKRGDSRHAEYKKTTGTGNAWELDALDPAYLRELFTAAIVERLPDEWNDRLERMEQDRQRLHAVADNMEER